LPIIAGSAAMECFHTRQAKRLLPLVAAAATAGIMCTGALARVLSGVVGISGLLAAGAAVTALAAPLPFTMMRSAPAPEAAVPEAERPSFFAELAETLRDVGRAPVVRVVLLSAIL